jgi:RimJ/RimL family protein N-acetyltransferase
LPCSRQDGEAYLAVVGARHATVHPTTFVIADKATDIALGAASVEIDQEGTGEPWIGRDHWGRGLAKEAVSVLVRHALANPDLQRLAAVTDPANVRAQRVLAACGLADCGLRERARSSRRGSTQERRYELVRARR